nr:MFS transporter [Nocardia tengchongensis]
MKLLADITPLRNPDYRRLWTTGIVTVIGAQLSVVAVPKQLYDITHSSSYVGLAGLFGLIPLIVFGLWGGALADAMDRRKMLLITSAGTGLTALAFWAQAAAGLNNVWLVLLLFSAQQAFFAMNQPARSAIYPRLLPPEQLPAANSLSMTVMQFGAIAGPVLAGMLIPFAGLSTLYLLDAIALLATLWASWKLPPIPPHGESRRAGLREVSTASPTWPPSGFCWPPSRWTWWPWCSVCRAPCSRRWRRTVSAIPLPVERLWACCSRPCRWARCWAGCSPAGCRGCGGRAWPWWSASCCGGSAWSVSAWPWA